ncbi:25569_t:CDS:2, partial [Gigaspora rosea]
MYNEESSLNINNNLSIEWTTGFTLQDQTNINSPNIYNNPSIADFIRTTQNNEDQNNHNLSIERTTCFAQDQTNTNLFNIYNAGITQHYEEQINNLQQYNAKSVIEDKHPVSLASRRKKRKESERCKKCNRKRFICDKTSKQCKDCYEASFRVLSGNKLIDDFIELAQFSYASFTRNSHLEFIPYEQFTNIEYLAKGGFSIIHRATWVISGCRPFYDRKHDEHLIMYILDGLRPKIPTNIPKELVELMERCWHQYPEKRNFSRSYKSEKRINYLYGELDTLINKAEKGKIKFTDNKGTKISPTEINDQAFYSSRPLTPLISKALTLQSMRLNSNVIT